LLWVLARSGVISASVAKLPKVVLDSLDAGWTRPQIWQQAKWGLLVLGNSPHPSLHQLGGLGNLHGSWRYLEIEPVALPEAFLAPALLVSRSHAVAPGSHDA